MVGQRTLGTVKAVRVPGAEDLDFPRRVGGSVRAEPPREATTIPQRGLLAPPGGGRCLSALAPLRRCQGIPTQVVRRGHQPYGPAVRGLRNTGCRRRGVGKSIVGSHQSSVISHECSVIMFSTIV